MLDATGVILAGGAGRRMGGGKAFVPFRGRPLIAWAVDLLTPLCRSVLVSGSDPGLTALGLPVVPDGAPGRGPAEGLLSSLRAAVQEWCVVVPCDAPFLSRELFLALWAARGNDPAVVPAWPDGRLEPLCALYHRGMARWLAEALDRGERRLSTILEQAGFTRHLIDAGTFGERTFLNLNNPEELDAATGLPIDRW